MRKKLVVGNWKMHFNASQSSHLLHRLQEKVETHNDVEVALAPSFLVLQPLSVQIDRRKFKLAAQDCYWQDEGAFTGEISATMLHDLVEYVIVGHSERRHVFNETDDEIAKKTASVLRHGMMPILCVGETAGERKEGETKQVLHDQLMVSLKNVTSEDIKNLVIAYEPVWAVGSGHYAKPHQVEEAVKTIRHNVSEMFGQESEDELRVLYGGSVEPDTTAGYFTVNGVDGLLVGGASLNWDTFSRIVEAVHNSMNGEGEN